MPPSRTLTLGRFFHLYFPLAEVNGTAISQASIDAYADGNVDGASNHYQKALGSYDAALDLIG